MSGKLYGYLDKPRRQRHVGHHQTMTLMNNTMKLHVQKTVSSFFKGATSHADRSAVNSSFLCKLGQ